MTFCTHAIESFQTLRTGAMRSGFKADSEGLDWLINVLHAAVKFKLPDGGRLIDKHKGNQHFSEMLRLPFNEVALEYTMVGETAEGLLPCPKRIALCLSSESKLLHPAMAKCLTGDGSAGIFVISLYRDDSKNIWVTPGGGGFLKCGHYSHSGVSLSETYLDHMRQNGFTNKDLSNDRWEADYFHFLPSMYERFLSSMGGDSEKVYGTIAADTNDEIMSAIDFCAIMNCSNVRTDMIPAPGKLNKKRLANDKPPMFEYRVLVLESDGEGIFRTPEAAQSSPESGRSGPRLHVRRGHIRRLKDRTIWINQMTVGAPQHGVITKEYKIVRAEL